jgi:hypothetical protein
VRLAFIPTCHDCYVARKATSSMEAEMPAQILPPPVLARKATMGPVVHVGAVFQRLADMFAAQPAPDAEKPRSVADLLEFGYSVTGADRRFPHMPA